MIMNKQTSTFLMRSRFLQLSKCIIILCLLSTVANAQPISIFPVFSASSFRGLDVLSDSIWWVSGQHNTVMKTEDAGKTWTVMIVGDTALHTDFRDIAVIDRQTVLIMGITNPAVIFKTSDAGNSWRMVHRDTASAAFLDAFDFWDKDHGICLADPIGNRWSLIQTNDGGESWKSLPKKNLPEAQSNEAAFAAGGTALRTFGKKELVFVTGGSESSRILFSNNKGKNWGYLFPGIKSSKSAGVFSFDKNRNGAFVLVGGDYQVPEDSSSNLAVIENKGNYSVTTFDKDVPGGYRCAIANAGNGIMIATGDQGTDISYDDGFTWKLLSKEGFYAVNCFNGTCLFSGKKGKIGLVKPIPGQ